MRVPLNTIIGRALLLGLIGLGAGCALEAGNSDQLEQAGHQDRARYPGHYTVDTRTTEPGKDAPADAVPGRVWVYELTYSDVILSPGGQLLLAMVPAPGPGKGYVTPGLVLLVRDLDTGMETVLSDLVDLRRINFSPDGKLAWLLRQDGQTVTALDLATLKVGPSHKLDSVFTVLDVAPDGAHLLLSNAPRNGLEEILATGKCGAIIGADYEGKEANRCHVGLVDLKTGKSHSFATPHPVRDLDFSAAHDEIVLTWSTLIDGLPKATVAFYEPKTGHTSALVEAGNCAGELELVPNSNLALMAPTNCARDPISIFDLKARKHLEDLPGFGPVAVTPDGKTAIGFTRRQDMENTWKYTGQKQKVGLIFVDLTTRKWQVVDYGERVPSFTLSPDGQWLYTFEHSFAWQKSQGSAPGTLGSSSGQLARWHVATRKRSPVSESLAPQRFVWTSDGARMYFLSGGALYHLDAGGDTVTPAGVGKTAELINIRPQGDYLVLGRQHEPTFFTVPLAGKSPVVELQLGL